jgi:hypothetical protein
MDYSTPPPIKKGLGPLGWLGIGCGGVVGLAILAAVIAGVFFGDQIKEFAEGVQKNPTRATATMMVRVSAGQMELVAEDDVQKRYTVKEKQHGTLTTIYWDAKKKAPAVVPGDFSAIPADAGGPAENTPASPPQ